MVNLCVFFFFSSRRRHTRLTCDWSSDVCSSDLKECDVAVDDRGFVTTGDDPALSLQTSVAGVFAIGDVRAGSVKRVGAAIGEGAAVVSQIHAFLAHPALALAERHAA